MTTSADPAPTPAEPGASTSELTEIWRAIGRLEGTAAALLEGQRELKEGQQELRSEFRTEQQELRTEFKTEQQELRTEFKAEQQGLRSEFKADLREVNRRLDRMFYAFLGIGGALLVSVYASRFIGA